MMDVIGLESEIKNLKKSSKLIEVDRSWETSFTKRAVIAVLTYILIGIYLQTISIPEPWLNAVVPSIAYVLSTSTLNFLKTTWIKISNEIPN